MQCRTEGIERTAPVRWRSSEGHISVYWEASGAAGASGYYLSPDPRIMCFFNDVSDQISVADRPGVTGIAERPMARVVYVPAGVPMWTSFREAHRFSHLDLHLHESRLLSYLTPSLGRSAALSAIRQPCEMREGDSMQAIARLLVDEVVSPKRHALYSENLVGSMVTGLLDLPVAQDDSCMGGLTPQQMNKLIAKLGPRAEHRMTVAEMAATVGLSESWFASVFKKTTGQTPLQWQVGRRVEHAKQLLQDSDLSVAGVAAQLGFSDQSHLTKVFRQFAGDTPAAWRRRHMAG